MAGFKTVSEDFCEVCGEPVKPVKLAKTSWAKKTNRLTGMCWKCENGHVSKTRVHKTKEIKT